MATQTLRAVAAGEKAAPRTISEAAESGTQRDLLVAMRTRIARTVDDPKCPPRDLASLTRRLYEVTQAIEAIDSESGDDELGEASSAPDAKFSSKAL